MRAHIRGGHRRRTLNERCSNDHFGCAAYPDGPCNMKPTNSNPATLARQRKRKAKRRG